MYPHGGADVNVLHVLRGNEYILFSIGRIGCVDLKRG
jgi:hypothetical protein